MHTAQSEKFDSSFSADLTVVNASNARKYLNESQGSFGARGRNTGTSIFREHIMHHKLAIRLFGGAAFLSAMLLGMTIEGRAQAQQQPAPKPA
ncbi:MAG: hypothetical protein ACXW3S_14525, partial [Rhodoplanes sp.]